MLVSKVKVSVIVHQGRIIRMEVKYINIILSLGKFLVYYELNCSLSWSIGSIFSVFNSLPFAFLPFQYCICKMESPIVYRPCFKEIYIDIIRMH